MPNDASSRVLRTLKSTFDAVLPRTCVLCGLDSGPSNLCRPCSADLPRPDSACIRCALPTGSSADPICSSCLGNPPPWDQAVAALAYRFPVDFLVCRFKFSRHLACGEVLAAEMLASIATSHCEVPDCIVPVPLHRTRLLRRTFNQAELLAASLGRRLALPVHTGWLRRCRRTRAQSGLNAADRRENLKSAFACTKQAATQGISGHLALIDDVCTTGETLVACTRLLRRAGAEKITIWVAARAPPP